LRLRRAGLRALEQDQTVVKELLAAVLLSPGIRAAAPATVEHVADLQWLKSP
jgi:hypothetical protein